MVKSEMNTQVKAQMTQHLEERMEDTVHAFHVAWLNQLEQGRSTWGDSDHKLRMRRALMWHTAMATQASSVSFSAGAGIKAATTLKNYNAPAKPGTKAYESFNSGMCVKVRSNQNGSTSVLFASQQ